MRDTAFELPLDFKGHKARMVVTRQFNGPWRVRTEVDGRVLGWKEFRHKAQLDRFHTRMQGWITQMEATEGRLAS